MLKFVKSSKVTLFESFASKTKINKTFKEYKEKQPDYYSNMTSGAF